MASSEENEQTPKELKKELKRSKEPMDLRQIQTENFRWVQHNFPGRKKYYSLLGVVEEVGELCHAHLKHEEKIRGFDDIAKFEAYAEDAIGDIVIFLADYCNANNFDLQDCVEKTWRKVRERDWQKEE